MYASTKAMLGKVLTVVETILEAHYAIIFITEREMSFSFDFRHFYASFALCMCECIKFSPQLLNINLIHYSFFFYRNNGELHTFMAFRMHGKLHFTFYLCSICLNVSPIDYQIPYSTAVLKCFSYGVLFVQRFSSVVFCATLIKHIFSHIHLADPITICIFIHFFFLFSFIIII